jgi:2-polyprenyl-3-methyl-5-hydroxy-6-metoxy-1,4-benzoquinol methylase
MKNPLITKNSRKAKDLTERYEGLKFNIKSPVLDVGGGDGVFLRTQGVREATILDLEFHQNEFNYISQDITKPLDITGKFKTIFLMECLEHIKNPLYLLAQCFDKLEDNGNLYISIPYTGINSKKIPKYLNFFYKVHSEHVNRWTLKEIIEDLDKLGFYKKIIQKRRRFKGLAFFLPHCWIVIHCRKRGNNRGFNHND